MIQVNSSFNLREIPDRLQSSQPQSSRYSDIFPSSEGLSLASSSNSKFRILVATDNHVGFRENDPIRGEDSYEAFEEVLKIAKEEKVDLLLLGGDLFHETTPS